MQDRQECGTSSCAGDTATVRSCADGACRSEPRGCQGLGCAGMTCAGRCPEGTFFMDSQCVACGGAGQICCGTYCPSGTCTTGRCCPPGQLWNGTVCRACAVNQSVCNSNPPMCAFSSWDFEDRGTMGFDVSESTARAGQPFVTGAQRFEGARSLAVAMNYDADYGVVVVGVRPCGPGVSTSLRGGSVSLRYKIVADAGASLPAGFQAFMWVGTGPGIREEVEAPVTGTDWQRLVVMLSPVDTRTVGQITFKLTFGALSERWSGTLYLDDIRVE